MGLEILDLDVADLSDSGREKVALACFPIAPAENIGAVRIQILGAKVYLTDENDEKYMVGEGEDRDMATEWRTV